MAIYIQNSTSCPLCGIVIKDESDVVAYPAMIWNELDPLAPISDALVHVTCLRSSGLRDAAEARKIAVQSVTGPGKRECRLCHHQITTPDEHLMLGHLTDDQSSFLYSFNFAQFHRSCLGRWIDLPALIQHLMDFNTLGRWKGPWLSGIVAELNDLHSNSSGSHSSPAPHRCQP